MVLFMIMEILTIEDKSIILSQNVGHRSSSDMVLHPTQTTQTSTAWLQKQV
jgi:hypothetical protein